MTDFEWLVLLLGCKATLILGLVAGLIVLAGRRWPRYCLLWQRLAVMALLALPAFWVLPTVGIPVLPVPPPNVADDTEHAGQPAAAAPQPAGAEKASSPNLSAAPAANSVEPSEIALPPTGASIVSSCLAAAYAVVAASLLIQFVRGWRGLSKLKRASVVLVDPEWQTTLKHWSTLLQVGRPVELRVSDDVSVPMTFYWRAPVILIPGDCLSACDQTQRDAIVVHELTHIAHGDFFWQAMTRLAAALYWIHPLAWLIRRQDGTLCERVCDASCSHHLGRELYARALVLIAGRKIFKPAAALGISMARTFSLKRRLTDLQGGATLRYSRMTRTQRVLLGGTAVLILGLIAVGTLTAQWWGPPPARVRMAATVYGQVLDKQDKPVANVKVNVSIERYDLHGYPTGAAAPPPWSATTDGRGRYTIKTGAPWIGRDDMLRIKTRVEGLPELSSMYSRLGPKSELPVQWLPAWRTVSGRLVDPQGSPVAKANVRFYAYSWLKDSILHWDSGSLPVDQRGMFSCLIPDEPAAVMIYPREFAPQVVKLANGQTELGTICVESGTSLIGRVVNKEGRGVAGTVVAAQKEDAVHLSGFNFVVETAVKTDDSGNFRLPPLRGTYRVSVTNEGVDYSQRLTVSGVAPPPMLPQRIDFNGEDKTREIIFREAETINVRGTVRWADGTGVPDFIISLFVIPPGWNGSPALASVRTDSNGRYLLRVPTPAKGVTISIDREARAADGREYPVKPVKGGDKERQLTFTELTRNVDDADWIVDQ